MANPRLAVEIIVEGNNAERVFKEIGRAARTTSQEMDTAGQRTTTSLGKVDKAADSTEQAMRDLDTAQKRAAKSMSEAGITSDKTARSLEKYRGAVQQSAAGLALMGASFTMYANQQRTHEVNLIALNRLYGEAADSYVQLADRIQSTTIFSNDEAVEAARIMGTLRENYGLTDAQIQQLILTSADLASMHGVTLTDASQRVAAAIRGEAESAEALGLTMNQASIDAQGLTLTMSNTEAAAFRVDALMQQTASSVGVAGEVAATTAGQVKQLSNEFQDTMTGIVSFTGALGQAAGGITSFGAEAGLMVTGLGQMGRALMAVKGAGGLAALAGSLAGPAGIAAAAGLAGYALWQLFTDVEDAGVVAFNKANDATMDLGTSINTLVDRISDARIQLNLLGDAETFSGLTGQIERQLELFSRWGDPSNWQNGTPLNWMDTGNPADLAAARAEWEELIALNGRLGDSTQTMAAQVASSYNTIINNSGAGSAAALQTAMNWVDAWQAGEITLAELYDRLNGVIADLPKYRSEAIAAADATNKLAEATYAAADAYTAFEFARSTTNIQIPKTEEEIALIEKRLRLYHLSQTSLDANAMAMLGLDLSSLQTAKTIADLTVEIEQGERAMMVFTQTTGSAKDDLLALEAQFNAAMRAASGLDDALYDIAARRGTATVDVAVNTTGAQNALGGAFRGIVGGSQAFAGLAGQVADWSGSLAHGITGQTKLDQLLLKGAISAKTYRDALDANHRIQEANNDVQEDALRIQAKQMPVMAALAEEQARWVDSLADMNVEQQTAALAYLDTGTSAKAMQLAQLAALASTDALRGSTTEMITGMAQADPFLKAMLIDMGLISEGADGTITVDFGDAKSDTDNLIASIDALTLALGGVPPSVQTHVNLIDNTTGPLALIQSQLELLDGKTSTVYINTVGGGLTLGAATGTTILPQPPMPEIINAGRIEGMATGGHLRLVGEAGPELVTLPTGAQVTNAAGTRGRLNPMGRGRSGGDVYKGNNITVVVSSEESGLARRADRMARRRRL